MKIDLGALPARIGKRLQGIFGSANKRMLNSYKPLVEQVNELEKELANMDEASVKERVSVLRQQVHRQPRSP